MTGKVMKFIGKIALSLAIFVGLMAVWNWQTVSSVARPTVQVIKAKINQPTPPVYNPTETAFYFPRLGIEAPMSQSAESSPLRSSDWNSIRGALEKGVSLNYEAGSLAEARLAFVTGHSSDRYPHAYSSIFAGLGQAKEGDEFVLTAEGSIWHYRVISKRVVDPRNVIGFSEAALATGGNSGHYVALVTCWPLLTDRQRLVVVGEYLGSEK